MHRPLAGADLDGLALQVVWPANLAAPDAPHGGFASPLQACTALVTASKYSPFSCQPLPVKRSQLSKN